MDPSERPAPHRGFGFRWSLRNNSSAQLPCNLDVLELNSWENGRTEKPGTDHHNMQRGHLNIKPINMPQVIMGVSKPSFSVTLFRINYQPILTTQQLLPGHRPQRAYSRPEPVGCESSCLGFPKSTPNELG